LGSNWLKRFQCEKDGVRKGGVKNSLFTNFSKGKSIIPELSVINQ